MIHQDTLERFSIFLAYQKPNVVKQALADVGRLNDLRKDFEATERGEKAAIGKPVVSKHNGLEQLFEYQWNPNNPTEDQLMALYHLSLAAWYHDIDANVYHLAWVSLENGLVRTFKTLPPIAEGDTFTVTPMEVIIGLENNSTVHRIYRINDPSKLVFKALAFS